MKDLLIYTCVGFICIPLCKGLFALIGLMLPKKTKATVVSIKGDLNGASPMVGGTDKAGE